MGRLFGALYTRARSKRASLLAKIVNEGAYLQDDRSVLSFIARKCAPTFLCQVNSSFQF